MSKFGDEFNIEKVKFIELPINFDVEEMVANKVTDGAGIGGVGVTAGEEEGKNCLHAIVLGSVVVTALIFVICVIVWRARRKISKNDDRVIGVFPIEKQKSTSLKSSPQFRNHEKEEEISPPEELPKLSDLGNVLSEICKCLTEMEAKFKREVEEMANARIEAKQRQIEDQQKNSLSEKEELEEIIMQTKNEISAIIDEGENLKDIVELAEGYYTKILGDNNKIELQLMNFNQWVFNLETGTSELSNVKNDLKRVLNALPAFEKSLENFKEDDFQNENAKKIKDVCDKYLKIRGIMDRADAVFKKFGDDELKSLKNLQIPGYEFSVYNTASVYEVIKRREFHMNNKEKYKALIPCLREQVKGFQELRTRQEDYEEISQKASEKIRNIVSNKNFNQIVKFSTDEFNLMEFFEKMKFNRVKPNSENDYEKGELYWEITSDNSQLEMHLLKIKEFLDMKKPSNENIDNILSTCEEVEQLLKNFNETRRAWAEGRKEMYDTYFQLKNVLDNADRQLRKLCIYIRTGTGKAEDACRQIIGVRKYYFDVRLFSEALKLDEQTQINFDQLGSGMQFSLSIYKNSVYSKGFGFECSAAPDDDNIVYRGNVDCGDGATPYYNVARRILTHMNNKKAYIKLVENLRSHVQKLRKKTADLQDQPSTEQQVSKNTQFLLPSAPPALTNKK